MKTWRPISVSRDQTVELELLSYLDGFVVLSIVLAIAAACVVVGRRRFGRRKIDDAQVLEVPTDHVLDEAASVGFAAPQGEPQRLHEVEPDAESDAADQVEMAESDDTAAREKKPATKKTQTIAKKSKTVAKRTKAPAKT